MMQDNKETVMLQEAMNAPMQSTFRADKTNARPKPTPKEVIPEAISSRTEYKRRFSFWEMYRSFACIPRAIPDLIRNRKSKLVDPDLVKRIELAVTEVSGCAACSYEHAKMALRQGMSGAEISSLLSGADGFIKPEDAKAIAFAQHFAESKGHAKEYAFEAVVKEYGEEEARVMLSAAQVMIAGNMYGIPYSAFRSRLKGKPFKDSSLFYELGMLIGGVLALPFALLHGILRGTFDLDNERLDRKEQEATRSAQQ